MCVYMWKSIKLCRKESSFSRKSPKNAGVGMRAVGKTLGTAMMYWDKYR